MILGLLTLAPDGICLPFHFKSKLITFQETLLVAVAVKPPETSPVIS